MANVLSILFLAHEGRGSFKSTIHLTRNIPMPLLKTIFWHNKLPPPLQWARVSSFKKFLDHTQRHTTPGRTPLDEWSARRRDLYLTKHNTHNRQKPMPPVGFEPKISAGKWPKTYALDRRATGTGCWRHFLSVCEIVEVSVKEGFTDDRPHQSSIITLHIQFPDITATPRTCDGPKLCIRRNETRCLAGCITAPTNTRVEEAPFDRGQGPEGAVASYMGGWMDAL
jgi:hypothetical protein